MRFTPMFITLCLLSLPAAAAGKHDHGTGRLDVAIEKDRITLNLELPMDTLVSFERAPRNAKEREALDAAGAKLKDGAALFLPVAAAQCTLKSAGVNLPFATNAPAEKGAEGHADVDGRYEFQCARPDALTSIDTALFKIFPRLYRVELQRIGPVGQGGGRLTPKAPAIRW